MAKNSYKTFKAGPKTRVSKFKGAIVPAQDHQGGIPEFKIPNMEMKGDTAPEFRVDDVKVADVKIHKIVRSSRKWIH